MDMIIAIGVDAGSTLVPEEPCDSMVSTRLEGDAVLMFIPGIDCAPAEVSSRRTENAQANSFPLAVPCILAVGEGTMPLQDSKQSERSVRSDREPSDVPQSLPAEDLVTPIEAEIQEDVEREFENEREFPEPVKTGIVSVNGEDVDEVHLKRHERAA